MSTLVITLPDMPAAAAQELDYVLTFDGAHVANAGQVPLALLPGAGEVVALVPLRRLSWQQLELPRGSLGRGFFGDGGATRLRAVLEGALEDRLLDDTAELHFAIEPGAQDGAPLWVAVCERAWLKAAVGLLEQAGRPVSRILPEFAPEAARELPDTLWVLGEPQDARLVALTHNSVASWPLSAAALAQINWPAEQPVVAEPAVAALAEQLCQRSVTIEQGSLRRLRAAQSAWDLAQFDLANSSGTRSWKRASDSALRLLRAPRWRPMRLALLAAALVNLIGLNSWAWQERSAWRAQRQAIDAVLTSTFPEVRVVVDAPLQMARELAALQRAAGQASGRDLEAMLGAFAALAPAAALPDAIDFSGAELRLKGLQMQPAELSALALALRPQGYLATPEAGGGLLIRPGAER